MPQRGEKKELVEHALANAREALGRKLAETSSQQKLLAALAETFGLPRVPRRIEVYDNSHIQGTNAVGAMIVAGPEGFRKNQYRKFNIRSADLTPGDDFGMMREVLERRFKRLLDRGAARRLERRSGDSAALRLRRCAGSSNDDERRSPWPDLVLIDGGQGQLDAARETLAALGVGDVPLIAIAKGAGSRCRQRDFLLAGPPPFKLPPRDPVLYFVAAAARRGASFRHRLAPRTPQEATSARPACRKSPASVRRRKRALLHHFGTLKAIERASIADLAEVPGINDETARKIHDFFHEIRGRFALALGPAHKHVAARAGRRPMSVSLRNQWALANRKSGAQRV